MSVKRGRRVPHSPVKRGAYSFILVAIVVTVGTLGMHYFESLSYIDSFYFMSMLATAQGPPTSPVTVAGKIFASIMAFVSVGAVVAALGFIFGPFFGALLRLGVEHIEEEVKVLEKREKEKSQPAQTH